MCMVCQQGENVQECIETREADLFADASGSLEASDRLVSGVAVWDDRRLEAVFGCPVDRIEPLPVREVTDLELGFERFNVLQSAFFRLGVHDCEDGVQDLFLCWNTAAGKTVVAEVLAERVLRNGGRVLYLSPLKALAEEKCARWQRVFKGFGVEVVTGDYRDFELRRRRLEHADVLITTTELMDAVLRNGGRSAQVAVERLRLVVVDEAHVMGTDRGPALESLLVRLFDLAERGVVGDLRALFLSATFANADEPARWLSETWERSVMVFHSDWRPVHIAWEIIPAGSFRSRGSYNWRDGALEHLTKVLPKWKGRVLVFTWTHRDRNRVAHVLRRAGFKVGEHHAGLSLADRKAVEQAFEDGEIEVLVATPTLAWGVNLSATHVVLFGDKRNGRPVEAWDVLQAGGRAGRPGKSEHGHVLWFRESQKLEQAVVEGPRVEGRMRDVESLRMHLIGEIAGVRRGVAFKDLLNWYRKTFSGWSLHGSMGKEGIEGCLMTALEDLLRMGMVRAVYAGGDLEVIMERLKRRGERCVSVEKALEHVDFKNERFAATELGRTAARLYYDPWQLRIYLDTLHDVRKKFRLDLWSPFAVALLLAVSGVLSDQVYLADADLEQMDREINETIKRLGTRHPHLMDYRRHSEAGYSITVELLDRLADRNYYRKQRRVDVFLGVYWFLVAWFFGWPKQGRRLHFRVSGLVWDADRTAEAVRAVIKRIGENDGDEHRLSLAIRLFQERVPVESWELTRVKGIGPTRARQLWELGIRSLEDLRTALSGENGIAEQVRKVVTRPLAEKILAGLQPEDFRF